MESNRLSRQSFGMFKICKDRILFELCPWKKERKKKDEQNRNFHIWFFNLLKVSGKFEVDIALE